jgi:hypothetical protein
MYSMYLLKSLNSSKVGLNVMMSRTRKEFLFFEPIFILFITNIDSETMKLNQNSAIAINMAYVDCLDTH